GRIRGGVGGLGRAGGRAGWACRGWCSARPPPPECAPPACRPRLPQFRAANPCPPPPAACPAPVPPRPTPPLAVPRPAPPSTTAEPPLADPPGAPVGPPPASLQPPQPLPAGPVSQISAAYAGSADPDPHFFDAYIRPGVRGERKAGERCLVSFQNLTGREVVVYVDGKRQALPPGETWRVEPRRQFVWQMEGRPAQS